LKQDKISILEQRLDQINQQETSLLFLGKSRSDGNTNRISLLSEIKLCLADYGISTNLSEYAERLMEDRPVRQKKLQDTKFKSCSGKGCGESEKLASKTAFQMSISGASLITSRDSTR